MNLTLHIFRKDIRHLYPEILLMLIGTAAFAWIAPQQWHGASPTMVDLNGPVMFLAPLLRILLPIAWLVLISRLVHDESLVGDRQFWITRPYTWTMLLAAKLLFLLAFLYVPFVLMQIYLLRHAGFMISPAFHDLLLYQLRLTAIFCLPFFAIATVTSNFARLTVTLLAGLLYIGGVFAAGEYFRNGLMTPPHVVLICAVLISVALAAIVVFQYATRRTQLARRCLASMPVVILLVFLLVPARALIERSYPSFAAQASPRLTFVRQGSRQHSGAGPFLKSPGKTFFSLPVQLAAAMPGQRLRAQGISIDLDAPGFHWRSPFMDGGGAEFSGPDPAIFFSLPDAVVNRVRDIPVHVQVQIAGLVSSTDARIDSAAFSPAFPAPGRGLCSLRAEGITTNCRYPLRLPAPIDVAAETSDHLCDSGQSSSPVQTAVVKTFIGSDDDALAFDFDPVALTPLSLVRMQANPDHSVPGYLCSGSRIAFTPHGEPERGQISVEIPDVVLGPYAMPLQKK